MTKTLTHKGYLGTVECDFEGMCLHGKLLFVNDVVSYQGDTVPEIEKAFKDAVDEYLELCQEIGRDPDKPFTGSFNIRIKPEQHRALAVRSANSGESINHIVAQAIYHHLNGGRKSGDVHYHYTYYNVPTQPSEKPQFSDTKIEFDRKTGGSSASAKL
ncbi:type II toxin-antitoxin system HicB family antitoxin [Pseudohongiella sp. O18]|uniref:type II toxin-antitoxin system HicB family antitoxin n=1 Tax=Pseudohongiella sp. O18 TaxID=2904248 RepID=UPI001F423697|nr:type II toxin-antitoxin system HicB family antitoxin [Pseudohongiella sp. O18]